MKKLLLCLLLCFNAYFLSAQVVPPDVRKPSGGTEGSWQKTPVPLPPGSNCRPTGPDYSFYRDLNNWIPKGGDFPLHNPPVKTIELNFNIFQPSPESGQGNFQETDKDLLIGWVSRLNQIFGDVTAPSDPIPGIPATLPGNDTRFRFDIGPPGQERIYFYQDDELYRTSNSTKLLHKVKTTDPGRTRHLNILISEGSYQARLTKINVTNGGSGYSAESPPTIRISSPEPAYGASARATVVNGQVTEIQVLSQGQFYHPVATIALEGGGGSGATAEAVLSPGADGYTRFDFMPDDDMFVVMLKHHSGYRSVKSLAHEIGHLLDLDHTFSGKHCYPPDYLADIYGPAGSGNCPHFNKGWEIAADAANNDRITNNLMGYGPENYAYISPMQAGIMHRSSVMSSFRKYIQDSYSDIPYKITKEETWSFGMRMYQDMIVDRGGVLHLTCSLTMPLQAGIAVNAGGKLVLDGGQVQPFTPQPWRGIVVNDGGMLELRNTHVADYTIQVKKGGTLLVPDSAAVALYEQGQISVDKGGFISISKNAHLTLQDESSVVRVHKGCRFGVNTTVMPKPANFVSSVRAIAFQGKGSVIKGSRHFRNKAPLQDGR